VVAPGPLRFALLRHFVGSRPHSVHWFGREWHAGEEQVLSIGPAQPGKLGLAAHATFDAAVSPVIGLTGALQVLLADFEIAPLPVHVVQRKGRRATLAGAWFHRSGGANLARRSALEPAALRPVGAAADAISPVQAGRACAKQA
jgi:hypothetical protein